jgi:hypothetical protein
MQGTRSPSKSFAEGFNQAADFEPEKLKNKKSLYYESCISSLQKGYVS